MRARSALFTLFGDVVRPAGGEAWLSTITTCMQTLGFRREAVRTALHRMTVEGWVQPRREGRYAAYQLTDRGVARLEAAAARIYRLRSQAWDGRWRLLLAPTLSADGLIAELEWLGYGSVQPGVWAHPHPHPEVARTLLAEVADGVTWLEGAQVESDAALAARAWSLADLQGRHRSFLADWEDVSVPGDPEAAFAMRLRLVHEWRTFLFLDPGLPAEVLPEVWPGFAAAEVFAEVYETLREPSWAFYAQVQRGAPTPPGAVGIVPAASPFAQGLAALHQA
ncbi:MAG TPA: PaaX family transcriptional regulator C-terminal domain-containing protein [Euzebya sp.]|nr:PaaX family transcriptional regulator C-terminal domain-containing protein [Euzebya sp.]